MVCSTRSMPWVRQCNIPGIDRGGTFYVPPGTARLQLQLGTDMLEKAMISSDGEPLAVKNFESKLGKVKELSVRWKPASHYEIK